MQQYNYSMTITKLVTLISILFLSISCVDYFKKDDVVYEIVNNRDYDITISYFLDHNELDSFTTASKETFSRTLGREAPFNNPSGEFEIGSIVVNFEDQRALLFYCPEDLVFTSLDLKCLKFFEG
ncbi:hypothetical protein SAMN06298216_2341 [Spirosomataceae bacterium TFI 002]|nr:hypothetical protein SAMN06298216_2341 [Spirosomataceae bacterium TFI 002]